MFNTIKIQRIMGNRTTISTSGYKSNSIKGLSTYSGGPLSHGGRYISRRKQYYDIRVGLGLVGG